MSDPPTHDRFDPKCVLMGDDGFYRVVYQYFWKADGLVSPQLVFSIEPFRFVPCHLTIFFLLFIVFLA